MKNNFTQVFPLSRQKSIKGTRRMAREKVLQLIMALDISSVPWEKNFNHVFYRSFNFEDEETISEKLLTPDEIFELESDIPIQWKDEDIEFAKGILDAVFEIRENIDPLIIRFAEHWDIKRFALVDKILIYIAIAEILKFPEIPTKVSINEVIEIAKEYSTDKSSTFINGMLDILIETLTAEGKIIKTGKGLLDK